MILDKAWKHMLKNNNQETSLSLKIFFLCTLWQIINPVNTIMNYLLFQEIWSLKYLVLVTGSKWHVFCSQIVLHHTRITSEKMPCNKGMVCYILCEKQWINDLGNKKWKYLCNHYELLWFVGKFDVLIMFDSQYHSF